MKFAHVCHDPFMKSSSCAQLLDAAGIKYVATELLKRASVITPNVPEAEVLTGMTIKDVADMEAAARKIVEMGARAVIIKGGHMERDRKSTRLNSSHTVISYAVFCLKKKKGTCGNGA